MSLPRALAASVAALVLAACAAFGSADSPQDDEADAAARPTEDGAAPGDGTPSATSDGGASFGNSSEGYVRCGDLLPDCSTKSDGTSSSLCCAPWDGKPTCDSHDVAFCTAPSTIRCDGPEDCTRNHKCRPNFYNVADEPHVSYACAAGDVALAACHDDSDCAGSDLKCRRLTCGAVVLGVCAGNATVWPDASPCSLD